MYNSYSSTDGSDIYVPALPSSNNLKLRNIPVTHKLVKNVITNQSKPDGPDCIPVVVLENRESEPSYILAELFKMCLPKSCFLDCWNISSVVPLFQNVGKRPIAKNYYPVSLLSVVTKIFEKLVIGLLII